MNELLRVFGQASAPQTFDEIRISIASPEKIRSWSYGEVKKPETINYRTFKPERDGLFCAKIFGPVKDYECLCGKYKRMKFRGVVCEKCGVEVIQSKVRRERMGHIELAAPAAHIWFMKSLPSRIGLLLDLSLKDLERVLYFEHFIVMEAGLTPLKPGQLLSEEQMIDAQESHGAEAFRAGIGAEAIREMLTQVDLQALREQLRTDLVETTAEAKRKKLVKRLKLTETFLESRNRPEWMILQVIPVIPPELRPLVPLDGGRFATSDLNDLYRRVINRNNRLKRLIELRAPDIIVRNEKRMLQEAVDALFDNGRRGRVITGANKRPLRSISDMLKGKQGRFRQNLLGKRVDYSGRSVIVVGPELKLHQCGLPKRMALELFKPFVMHALVDRGLAHNIKSAKRIVERARPEVWDVLDDVIKTRPVLLNRAPTLHRLGIQAFEPVLVEGSAIQIHPLVCAAFNADFDGDQMAVHVPLAREAVAEARQIMLSTKNLLSPSSGDPMVAPRLDIVLGCYYLTAERADAKGEYKETGSNGNRSVEGVYGSFQEAILAHDLGILDLQAKIKVRDRRTGPGLFATTVGRVLFNETLPEELGFRNETMDSKALKRVVQDCYRILGMDGTAEVVDRLKDIGFKYATKSGVTISVSEIKVPEEKAGILAHAEGEIHGIDEQYQMGLITGQERYDARVEVWNRATEELTAVIQRRLPEYGSVFLMATSGAKGNIAQIRQMAGMRGLMSDPSGRIIDLPIRGNFREGLSVLEYFISTHGARKGLADTALRTADSGYLTRRLIDVAQDVITLAEDCETLGGVWITEPRDKSVLESLQERIVGRHAASAMADPETGEVIVDRDQEIDSQIADRLVEAGFDKVHVRSPLTCALARGVCCMCYGRNPARGTRIELREAVGIVAAQSIGEPGTQLTMRTFHTGGVYMAGGEITTGLPRVQELFEARVPKNKAIMSEIDGLVEIAREGEARRVRVVSSELYSDRYDLPEGGDLAVSEGQVVEAGAVLARSPEGESANLPAVQVVARLPGRVTIDRQNRISILYEEREEREYAIPATGRIRVEVGDYIRAGEQLTDGPLDPHDILHIMGPESVQLYIVEEVQKIYRNQGQNINDKHIEVIVRQMLRKVRIDSPGDTTMLPSELVDRFEYEVANAKVFAEGGEPATAVPVLLGITKASLSTSSFLAAASFQETTRVLTEAAISGMTDRLLGLKENVIIGKLIPARAPITVPPRPVIDLNAPRRLLEEGEEEEGDFDIDLEVDDELDAEEDLDLGDVQAGEVKVAVSAFVADPEKTVEDQAQTVE